MDEIVHEEKVHRSDTSAIQSGINAIGRLLLLIARKNDIPEDAIKKAMGGNSKVPISHSSADGHGLHIFTFFGVVKQKKKTNSARS